MQKQSSTISPLWFPCPECHWGPFITILPFSSLLGASITPWELPNTNCCQYFNTNKPSISKSTARQLFLSHAARHAISVTLHTHDSKSDPGVGFFVVIPDSSRSETFSALASSLAATSSLYFSIFLRCALPHRQTCRQ